MRRTNQNLKPSAFIQYTSGSTGKPKGAVHVHSCNFDPAEKSFNEVFQIKEGETYWCTADPAWITGLVYGIIVAHGNPYPANSIRRQFQYRELAVACLQDENSQCLVYRANRSADADAGR